MTHGLHIAVTAAAATLGAHARAQCSGVPVPLRNATATWTQNCFSYMSIHAIDGNPATGWAIGRCAAGGDESLSESLTIETAFELAAESPMTVTIHTGGFFSGNGGGFLNLGRFRVLVAATPGESGGWSVFMPTAVTAVRCNAFGAPNPGLDPTPTLQPDGSILVSGANPEYSLYTIHGVAPIVVRAIRLEVIDPNGPSLAPVDGLPTGGPGRHTNGNMVIWNFTLAGDRAQVEITRQPDDGLTCPEGAVTLHVAATGSGLSYQWRRNEQPIPGATSDTYITPPGFASAGNYDCVVSDGCTSATSRAAVVRVCAAEYNCDGFIDFFDYDDFVADFEAGRPKADIDTDGFVDFFDFDAFVASFEAGC